MRQDAITLTLAIVMSASAGLTSAGHDSDQHRSYSKEHEKEGQSVQLGPRPFSRDSALAIPFAARLGEPSSPPRRRDRQAVCTRSSLRPTS